MLTDQAPVPHDPFGYYQPQQETVVYDPEAEQAQRFHDVAEHLGALVIDEPEAEPTYAAASYSETLENAEDAASERAKAAIETSKFIASPEVAGAIEGYYADHTKLAATVEFVVRNPGVALAEGDDESMSFDTYATRTMAQKMMELNADPATREQALKMAQETTDRVLFNEASVGASTLTPSDVEVIGTLAAQIKTAALKEGLAFQGSSGEAAYWHTAENGLNGELMSERRVKDIQETRLRSGQDTFWKDTRHAGQLLFHNTGNLGDIIDDGYALTSRTGQIRRSGAFNAQTSVYETGDQAHTNVPHFSENYDWRGYKLEGNASGDRRPGTIALPLAEIIKTAPYARNKQYGIVELKDSADKSAVTINDGATEIGPGSFDGEGADGGDRVFFADYRADHAQEAHDYDLTFGRDADADNPDGSRILVTQSELRTEYPEGYKFGDGADRPIVETLPFDFVPFENNDWQEARAMQDAEEAKLKLFIKDLQARSRESRPYKDKIVVPLRSGVIEFYNEGTNPIDALSKYQQRVEHSMVDGKNLRKSKAAAAA